MSDAQLPPLDPDEVEQMENTERSEPYERGQSDAPAVADAGAALLAPPVPSPSANQDEEAGDEDR